MKGLILLLFLLVSHLQADELVEMVASSGESPAEPSTPNPTEEIMNASAEGPRAEERQIEELLTSNKTQLVEPDETVHLSPINLSIEQFLERGALEDIEEQSNLTELAIEFQLYKLAGKTQRELNKEYGRALENLIRVLPKLKILHPIGGHFYAPVNGTFDQLTDELVFVRNGLDALTSQMHKKNLTLSDEKFDYIKYTLYLGFDQEAINETEYYALLNRTFGYKPMQLINPKASMHSVSLIYDVNDINLKLDVLVYNDLEAIQKTGLRLDERLDYKKAVGPLSELDRNEIVVPKFKEQAIELLA